MIKLTEIELEKLKTIAYDETAVEALKKFFLNEFLDNTGFSINDTSNILAAQYICIGLLKDLFTKLERMKEKESENTTRKNVV